MTVRFYVHSIAKRAEAVALVDLGAIENFMNLSYARWLKLPIQTLQQLCKIFNVDRTTNKSGELKYFTDLEVQMGPNQSKLRFFLMDLGENKAILGYLWFAAVQPKIDWKKGWIDFFQLPIILRANNAKRACFIPRSVNKLRPINTTQYFIGKVTIRAPEPAEDPSIPLEYRRHIKIFSEQELQCLPKHTVWDHAIELLPGVPDTLPRRLLPSRDRRSTKIHGRTSQTQHHLSVMESLCSKLLLHKEEGWQVTPCSRLPTPE